MAVGFGDDIVCTITNTRETGKLEVVKKLNPNTDPGKFNLQIDGNTDPNAANVGDGGSTGEETRNTGTHTVGETAGTGTALADYQKSIVCKGANGTGSVVAQTSGDSAGPLNVSVGFGDDIVCTITNTRETGTIVVTKNLNPNSDPGKFNLQIDGSSPNAGSQNVGHGGTTGAVTVNTGSHSVGETEGTGTSLSNYTSSISCSNGTSGAGTSLSGVVVTYGQQVTCTITNTRNTGTIEVIKKLVPTVDPGRFNLQVDGTTKKTDAGDGGTTGAVTVNTGPSHSVGETAGTGTTLSHFNSSIACTRNGSPANSGNGTSLGGITVNKNDVVVCTITNTRAPRPGRMTGGGSVFGTNSFRTTHGFELHCDKNNLPNRLQINWGGGVGAFHLLTLTSAFCFDDPTIGPYPPTAEFDTYVGTGIGRYKDQDNATAEWTFTDAGEPGTVDRATIKIRDAFGNVVLFVSGTLQRGNQQAHLSN